MYKMSTCIYGFSSCFIVVICVLLFSTKYLVSKRKMSEYYNYSDGEIEKIYNSLYCKTDEEVNNSLELLKDWIKKEAHLPQNEEDNILRKMLMLNKYSIEKTKSKLETYYSGKNFLPELFEKFSPKDKSIQKLRKQCLFLPLPYLTPAHERVIIIKLSEKNQGDFNAIDFIKMCLMSCEVRLLTTDYSISDISIYDLADTSLSMVGKIPPRLIQNTLNYINGSYTDRIKSMNFINVPSYAYTIITFIKSVLKNKLAERVHVHKDLNSLYDQIPKQYLPKDYGGEQQSIKDIENKWYNVMEKYDKQIIERSKMKSNEKLRIGEPIKSELFGLQGSFQKLILD